MKDFFTELKRRNVYKVAVAYIVAGWALSQGIAQVFPVFDVPNWAIRSIVILIILGLPVALVLAWMFEITPEGIKRTAAADAIPGSAKTKNDAWLYVVVIGAAISIGLFFLGRFTAKTETSGQIGVATIPEKSIAVLPFENLSRDPDNAFFASGIQDEILVRLAKIGALKVISRTSTQQYQSKPRNLSEIGRQLGVANVLEGSVQKAGNSVHINVQLIKAATDEYLWAESYNRKLDDIFGVEGEVATAIAEGPECKSHGQREGGHNGQGDEQPGGLRRLPSRSGVVPQRCFSGGLPECSAILGTSGPARFRLCNGLGAVGAGRCIAVFQRL